jgi:branched-subunit amino acid transport protein AzlD
MIKESFAALGASTRDLFRNWRGLLLLTALYGLLLASVYYFFAVGVANVWQLIITALTAVAAPLLFFMFQAAAANAALPEATAGRIARRAPRDFVKVLLLAVPVAVFAVLFVYLLGKLQGWLPKVEEAPHYAMAASGMGERPVPLHWQDMFLSSAWLVLLGFVLPLAAAHLWLSAARVGMTATLKGFHRVVGRAFAPRSVLVYAVGFFIFGMMPYFVFYTRTAFTNGWSELAIFGLRLALVFVLTLLGWVVTLGALARVTPPEMGLPVAAEPAPTEPTPEPAVEPEPVAEPQLQA